MDRWCHDPDAAAPVRLAVRSAPQVARHRHGSRDLATDDRAPFTPPSHLAPGRAAAIDAGGSADGDRLASSRRAAAGQRAERHGSRAARGDSRARARPHSPSRLPRQPVADARRNAVVLPPRRVVAVAAHPDRAGKLLRRSRRQPLRGSVRVRASARRSRNAAGRIGPPRPRGDRRVAAASGSARADRPLARGPCAWMACGQRRGRVDRGHCRERAQPQRARRRSVHGRRSHASDRITPA